MCNHRIRRNPIFCILPPHIVRNIAEKGSAKERRAALKTLAHDSTFRSLRATATQLDLRPARRVASLMGEAERNRSIYTADGRETLPGELVRSEGANESRDPAVNEAYDGLGATYDFYFDIFERNSIDDAGLPLDATVHYGKDYDNAFWNGERMVFGDGDGDLFNRFTISVDVIGHELTHGVTQDEAQLTYLYQPGALNESISDVFGSLVKQYKLKQEAARADWLIGEGLFTPRVQGVALRSMKAPGTAYDDPVLGKDPQPASMSDFVHTNEDNGGVHTNSGIPNHAFYLAAVGLGGHAWEKAGRIWYETMRDSRLKPNVSFRRFASLTGANAARLYGVDSNEQKVVQDSWRQVGVIK
ncbi:MAG: M4 family metallopeptidase [Betaproteobacteria bacterium]